MTSTRVEALCIGQPVPFRGEELSAIGKTPVSGPIHIGREGLAGDAQADRRHHGGPDMALHHFPLDHHAFWRREIGDHPLLDLPGAFGTNIATHGLTEQAVNLGARYRLGSALIEVSRPRQPCWKIEHRFGHKNMLRHILKTRRCGWYYRVIEEGTAQAGDMLEQVTHGREEWPVDRVFEAIWGTSEPMDRAQLYALTEVQELAPALRDSIRRKLENAPPR
ncbi:MOSC domain-containing protein [Altererythrobacter sp. FM1]|uniref:MOSC domain-containing protein n=1 Tax=Tsuneonella flava TaxID=2055955 RepID=UPI000C80FE13|nr:MOSC domain-containing protein [Tsuneonella flava]ROT95039.1 MOSC domain-containing protein [Altererythrobacter sp. FM1]